MLFYFFQVEKKIVSTEIGVLLKMDHPNIVSQIKFPGVSCGQSEGGRRGGRGSVEKRRNLKRKNGRWREMIKRATGNKSAPSTRQYISRQCYIPIFTHIQI